MDHDESQSSACATCDLAARLRAEIAQADRAARAAEDQLAAAWRRTHDAGTRRALLRTARRARADRDAFEALLQDVTGPDASPA
jgi:hypothetical protein